MMMHSTRFLLVVGLLICCPTIAFSRSASFFVGSSKPFHNKPSVHYKQPVTTTTTMTTTRTTTSLHVTTTVATATRHSNLFRVRGGQQQPPQEHEQSPQDVVDYVDNDDDNVVTPPSTLKQEDHTPEEEEDVQLPPATAKAGGTNKLQSAALFAVPANAFASFGKMYASSLESFPIRTKSITAGILFALSDVVAQRLERSPPPPKDNDNDNNNTAILATSSPPPQFDWIRMISSGLVGLLYFGPAAHAWYNMIFQLLPGTSLFSTLQKATLGQCFFGPSFTCLFFAIALLRGGTFTFQNWGTKIQQDLPGAWMAGLGFWPFVDLISYSLIAPQWIPLFVNACSFVWTIYISVVSNR